MAMSKKKFMMEAKKKIKTQLIDIEEQRNIIVNYIDDMVDKAKVLGRETLSITETSKFTKQSRLATQELADTFSRLIIIRTHLPNEEGTDTDISESEESVSSRQCRGSSPLKLSPRTETRTETDQSPKPPPRRKDHSPVVTHSSPYVNESGSERINNVDLERQPQEVTDSSEPKTSTNASIDSKNEGAESLKSSCGNSSILQAVLKNTQTVNRSPAVENEVKLQQTDSLSPTNKSKHVTIAEDAIINSESPYVESERLPINVNTAKSADETVDETVCSQRKLEWPASEPDIKKHVDSPRDTPRKVPPVPYQPEPKKRHRKMSGGDVIKDSVDAAPEPPVLRDPPPRTTTVPADAFNTMQKLGLGGLPQLDLTGGRVGTNPVSSWSTLDVYVFLIDVEYAGGGVLIWIQPQNPKLDDMQDELGMYMARHQESFPSPPEVGTLCAAVYEDESGENWCRGRVMNVIEPRGGQKMYNVLYIDFGNAMVLEIEKLRPLDMRFMKLPPHAIPCVLAGLWPLGGHWQESWLQHLGSLVLQKERVHVELAAVEGCPLSLVRFFVTEQMHHSVTPKVQNMTDVNKHLIDDGYAEPCENAVVVKRMLKMLLSVKTLNTYYSCIQVIFAQQPNFGIENFRLVSIIQDRMRRKHLPRYGTSASESTEETGSVKSDDRPSQKHREPTTKPVYSWEQTTPNRNPTHNNETKQADTDITTTERDTMLVEAVDKVLRSSDIENTNINANPDSDQCTSITRRGSDVVAKNLADLGLDLIKKEMENQDSDRAASALSQQSSSTPPTTTTTTTTGGGTSEDAGSITNRSDSSRPSSQPSSARKLKELGLPRRLPKSCAFSDAFNTIMASTEDETESDGDQIVGEYLPVEVYPDEDGCISFMMSHVENPSSFWVHQICEDTGVIVEGVMHGLNNHMALNKPIPLRKLEGACAAKYSQDDKFYRGNILSTEVNSNGQILIHVYYVDFGNSEWVTESQVFHLPTQFLDLPPQAIYCTAADIAPSGASSEADGDAAKQDSWSEEAVKKFLSLCPYDKVFIAYVLNANNSEDNSSSTEASTNKTIVTLDKPLPVLIVDTSEDRNIWISFQLSQARLAVHKSLHELFPQDKDEEIEKWKEDVRKEREQNNLRQWDPMAQDYMSIRNSYKVDIDDPGVATIGYKAEDEKRICKYFTMKGGCWAGLNCPMEHVPLEVQQSVVTTDRREVWATSDDHQVAPPREGSWVAVEITTLLTPAHFYATFPFGTTSVIDLLNNDGETRSDEGYSGSTTNTESLEQLMERLNAFYSKKVFRDTDLIIYAPGEIVVAKFTDDQWYRARVLEADPEVNKVTVFYVDYGNKQVVHENDVRQIEAHFMLLPFQATECFLPLEPAGALTWSPEAKQTFREMTDGKYLFAHVLASSSGMLSLELYDTEKEEININEALVEKGYAVPASINEPSSQNPALMKDGLAFRPG